jgi:hypothetical protein
VRKGLTRLKLFLQILVKKFEDRQSALSSLSFASPALVIVISAPLPPPLGFGFMTRDSEARVRVFTGARSRRAGLGCRAGPRQLAGGSTIGADSPGRRHRRSCRVAPWRWTPLRVARSFEPPVRKEACKAGAQVAAAAGGPDVEAGCAGGRARGGGHSTNRGPPCSRLPAKGHGAGSAGPSPLGVGLLPMDGRPGAACHRVELGNEGRSRQPSVSGRLTESSPVAVPGGGVRVS